MQEVRSNKDDTSRKKLGWIQEQQAVRCKKQEATNVGPTALPIRSCSLTGCIGSDIAIIYFESLDGRFRFIYIKATSEEGNFIKRIKNSILQIGTI